MAQSNSLSFLDNEIDRAPKDYVIVCNYYQHLDLGDSYKGRKVRRFKMVKMGMVYVMPDPMITDEEILELYGTGR
jgi:hypothetical protein